MLRIEVTEQSIKIELWTNAHVRGDLVPNRFRLYPNTPATLGRLQAAIAARRARGLTVNEYPAIEGDRGAIILTYNEPRRYTLVTVNAGEFPTHYDSRTDRAVISKLENARAAGWRLKITFGDPRTGEAWGINGDHPRGYTESGYVGRTNGRRRVLILLPNRLSHGGMDIMTRQIVKIEFANKKAGGVLYDVTPGAKRLANPFSLGQFHKVEYT